MVWTSKSSGVGEDVDECHQRMACRSGREPRTAPASIPAARQKAYGRGTPGKADMAAFTPWVTPGVATAPPILMAALYFLVLNSWSSDFASLRNVCLQIQGQNKCLVSDRVNYAV